MAGGLGCVIFVPVLQVHISVLYRMISLALHPENPSVMGLSCILLQVAQGHMWLFNQHAYQCVRSCDFICCTIVPAVSIRGDNHLLQDSKWCQSIYESLRKAFAAQQLNLEYSHIQSVIVLEWWRQKVSDITVRHKPAPWLL
jgi:hypothetical protein